MFCSVWVLCSKRDINLEFLYTPYTDKCIRRLEHSENRMGCFARQRECLWKHPGKLSTFRQQGWDRILVISRELNQKIFKSCSKSQTAGSGSQNLANLPCLNPNGSGLPGWLQTLLGGKLKGALETSSTNLPGPGKKPEARLILGPVV